MPDSSNFDSVFLSLRFFLSHSVTVRILSFAGYTICTSYFESKILSVSFIDQTVNLLLPFDCVVASFKRELEIYITV